MSRRGWERFVKPYVHYRIPDRPGYDENPLWTIHVARLLDKNTCEWVIQMVEAHTAKDGWSTARHAWHPTTDIAVSSIPVLDHWARKLLLTTVLPSIADLFGFETRHLSTEGPASPSLAACLKDLFAVRYRPGTQDRLAPHRDGNLLSFNILLSEPGSFEGGGTRFAALQGMEGGSLGFCASDGVVRPSTVGDLTMHTGKLLHEGVRVTRGTRYILVGFVRVASPKVNQAFLDSKPANQSKGGLEADYNCVTRALVAPATHIRGAQAVL